MELSAASLKPLRLDRWGTVVKEERRAGFIGAEVLSEKKIVELYPDIVRSLSAGGYTLLGGDNEGFEAEISFTDPKKRHVSFSLRQHSCSAQLVVMRVLVQGRG